MGRRVPGMHPMCRHPQTPRQVVEQYPVWTVSAGLMSCSHALVPYERDYAQTLSSHLTALNERVIKNVAIVQKNTVDTTNEVQDSLQNITASFMNMKTDMIAAMRDMLYQQSVKKAVMRDLVHPREPCKAAP